jgi:outer membrane protein assembly factor BamB
LTVANEADRPLIVAGPGWVRAHDVRSGAIRWEHRFGEDRDNSPTIASHEGRVFVGSNATLFCIDEASGHGLWKVPLSVGSTLMRIHSRPTMIARGGRVFVTRTGFTECFDLQGARIWALPNPTGGVVSMSLGGETAQGDVNY